MLKRATLSLVQNHSVYCLLRKTVYTKQLFHKIDKKKRLVKAASFSML